MLLIEWRYWDGEASNVLLWKVSDSATRRDGGERTARGKVPEEVHQVFRRNPSARPDPMERLLEVALFDLTAPDRGASYLASLAHDQIFIGKPELREFIAEEVHLNDFLEVEPSPLNISISKVGLRVR